MDAGRGGQGGSVASSPLGRWNINFNFHRLEKKDFFEDCLQHSYSYIMLRPLFKNIKLNFRQEDFSGTVLLLIDEHFSVITSVNSGGKSLRNYLRENYSFKAVHPSLIEFLATSTSRDNKFSIRSPRNIPCRVARRVAAQKNSAGSVKYVNLLNFHLYAWIDAQTGFCLKMLPLSSATTALRADTLVDHCQTAEDNQFSKS